MTDICYNSNREKVRVAEIKSGLKIYYTTEEACKKLSAALINANIDHRIAFNPDGNFWSVYIL